MRLPAGCAHKPNSQAAANSTHAHTRMQLATADLDLSTLALLHARADVFSRHACRVSLCESCLGRRRRLLPPRARREARPPQVVLWRARARIVCACLCAVICGEAGAWTLFSGELFVLCGDTVVQKRLACAASTTARPRASQAKGLRGGHVRLVKSGRASPAGPDPPQTAGRSLL